MINVALIGTGRWGPNIAASMELTECASITALCDLNQERLQVLGAKYPRAYLTSNVQDVLNDSSVTAVAISTPACTHFEFAKAALKAGKHVLVEKPLAVSSAEAIELVHLAEDVKRVLLVGHVFRYNASIQALKNLVRSEAFGQILYIHSERTNLGPVRTDVNVLWDLAIHDVSILMDLVGSDPKEVNASGDNFLNKGLCDVVFLTYRFPNNVCGHVHASWLNPRKVRQITVVGTKQMAVWDDLNLRFPIVIYDKGVRETPNVKESPDTFIAYKTAIVDSGHYAPAVEVNEPLKEECRDFINCIQTGARPLSDGYFGLRAIQAIEAAEKSISNSGITSVIPSMVGQEI